MKNGEFGFPGGDELSLNLPLLLCGFSLPLPPPLSLSLSALQSKAATAGAGQVPEDQDRLLGEAKRQVDKSAFEMKSSLVSQSTSQLPYIELQP